MIDMIELSILYEVDSPFLCGIKDYKSFLLPTHGNGVSLRKKGSDML